jgi:hypothetical protein
MNEYRIPISEIKTGDNLLVSSSSFLAKAIQFFQRNRWNHSAMCWWAYDELFVIEADSNGIAITKMQDYLNSNKSLMILKPKFNIDGSELGKFMLPKCGKIKYDKFNLLVDQPVRFVTGGVWIGKKGNNATKRFICGEWVAYCYNYFNKEIFKNWYEIAPVDIYNDLNFEHFLLKD